MTTAPIVPVITPVLKLGARSRGSLLARAAGDSVKAVALAARNRVLVATDDDIVDYGLVARSAKLDAGTRRILARFGSGPPQILTA